MSTESPIPDPAHTGATKPVSQAPALGESTARGFAWLTAQSIGTKVVNTGGQIVLAWLLLKEDFGLIGVAYTVTAFTSLLEQLGVGQILVQRQKHFRRWATPAFWMSMATGLLSALVLVIAAPFVAKIYDNSQVVGLLYVLAIASPINTLSMVPRAKLQNDLRFALIAKVGWAEATVQMGLSVVLACFLPEGYGAYAFVIPRPVAVLVRVVIMWWAAKPPVRFALQLNRWKYLYTDSALLLGALLCSAAITQVDRMFLGIRCEEDRVGLYHFAVLLSMQTATLFSFNLVNVLFPVLSKMQDEPKRQLDAYLRATKLLAVITIPVCLLQAALADSAVRLVFDPKWEPAIPALQVLSIGMAMRAVGWPALSLIQAQGRFRTRFWLAFVSAGVFMVAVGLGAWQGEIFGAAVAVAVVATILGPINIYVAVRGSGGGWRDVFNICAGPVGVSVFVVGTGVLAAQFAIPASWPMRDIIRIILMLCWSGALYVPIISRVAPQAWSELRERMRKMGMGR